MSHPSCSVVTCTHKQKNTNPSTSKEEGELVEGVWVGIPLIPYLIWIPRKKSEMVFAAFLFRLWFFFSLRFSFIFRSCCFQFRFTSLTDVFTFWAEHLSHASLLRGGIFAGMFAPSLLGPSSRWCRTLNQDSYFSALWWVRLSALTLILIRLYFHSHQD